MYIENNISGQLNPISKIVNLAAGYSYQIEVNATNFLDNNSSTGYTKSIDLLGGDISEFTWEPRSANNLSGCNDTNNSIINFNIKDGHGSINQGLNQVGEYRLNIVDKTWTSVDSNTLYMKHHSGSYYTNNFDCGIDLNLTHPINSTINRNISSTYNGCFITTSHDNSNPQNLQKFRDYNVSFHPYRFNMNGIIPSIGLNNQALGTNPYVYMSDMSTSSEDENMSFHLSGVITAIGATNLELNNFVDNCYAVPLDLNLTKSDTSLNDESGTRVIYQAKFHNNDINGSLIITNNIDTNETNTSKPVFILLSTPYFNKDMNGSVNTILNVNYDRNINSAANPKSILYSTYTTNCNNPQQDCSFYADLKTNETSTGQLNINRTIHHYYGKTNAPRQRFVAPEGTSEHPATDFIYYEVYCNLNTGCDKTSLQGGIDSNSTNDPRWFINNTHTPNFGTAGVINQKGYTPSSGYVRGTTPTGNHLDSTNLIYNTNKGYPYKTTMENKASNWLLYNKYNILDTHNEFEVEFDNNNSNWAGAHETDTTTKLNASPRTNRRTMW